MNKSSLVFLHGFPFDASSWNPQVEHFQNSYFTIAEDLIGHGKGKKPEGPWMINHYVEDLKATLDQKDVEKAILCGVSMGGYIAMNFCLKYPDRVEALILSNTQAPSDSNENKDKRFETIQKIHREGLKDFADSFSKSVLSVRTLNSHPHIQKKLELAILKQKPEHITLVLGALASRKDLTTQVQHIKCPTLVITGSEDKVISPLSCELLAKSIRQAHFEKIEGTGHLPNLERPQEFNQILSRFIESLKGKFDHEDDTYNHQQITSHTSSSTSRK